MGLVTASAHAYVLVSKELRAWKAPDRREHRNLVKSTRDGEPRRSDVGIEVGTANGEPPIIRGRTPSESAPDVVC